MNEYLFDMINELSDEEFNEIWNKHKIHRKNESESGEIDDEVLCM